MADLAGLSEAKNTVKRGDRVTLVVIRDGKEVALSGDLPPPSHYFLFKRERPSAMARGRFAGNRIDLETSRVGALRILIHGEMVRFDMPVVVRVNGTVVHEAMVAPDARVLLRHFLESRDRKRLVVAEVPVSP